MRPPVGFEALPAALVADIMAGFFEPQAARDRPILAPRTGSIVAKLGQALSAHAPEQNVVRRAVLGVPLEAIALGPLRDELLGRVGVALRLSTADRVAENRQPAVGPPEACEGVVQAGNAGRLVGQARFGRAGTRGGKSREQYQQHKRNHEAHSLSLMAGWVPGQPDRGGAHLAL